MSPDHTCTKHGLDRRLLLIGATMVAGSVLVSGIQILSVRAQEPSSNDKSSAKDALLEVQREPSATGYPRPFKYAD
jgi:hypothetical protein